MKTKETNPTRPGFPTPCKQALRMEIFLWLKNLIENCKKNCKQTCGKQKIANVSSVNECHKIDTSSWARKTKHMRSRQCDRPLQDDVQTVKSHDIQNGYYFVCGTWIVSILLCWTQWTLSFPETVPTFSVGLLLGYCMPSWLGLPICFPNIENLLVAITPG